MSSKTGLVLSMIFILNLFLFSIDIVCYQLVISKIDMVSVNIRPMIQNEFGFEGATNYVSQVIPNGKLVCLTNCNKFLKGNIIKFEVSGEYKPILGSVLGASVKTVSVQRAIVIP